MPALACDQFDEVFGVGRTGNPDRHGSWSLDRAFSRLVDALGPDISFQQLNKLHNAHARINRGEANRRASERGVSVHAYYPDRQQGVSHLRHVAAALELEGVGVAELARVACGEKVALDRTDCTMHLRLDRPEPENATLVQLLLHVAAPS